MPTNITVAKVTFKQIQINSANTGKVQFLQLKIVAIKMNFYNLSSENNIGIWEEISQDQSKRLIFHTKDI